ncbi:hypothetical protein GCM10020331_087880 [Ectobacillus funiculus]
MPNADLQDVKEGSAVLTALEGIASLQETEAGVSFVIGSGSYRFVYPNKRGLNPVFSRDTKSD